MLSWFSHGSGIIIIITCGNSRPVITSISTQLSNCAESLPSVLMTGTIFLMSPLNKGDLKLDCAECIQLTFPRNVLISPLCAMYRFGCARSQLGNVLVENREWTSASAVVIVGSLKSG